MQLAGPVFAPAVASAGQLDLRSRSSRTKRRPVEGVADAPEVAEEHSIVDCRELVEPALDAAGLQPEPNRRCSPASDRQAEDQAAKAVGLGSLVEEQKGFCSSRWFYLWNIDFKSWMS